MRSGPPVDDEADVEARAAWAGVLPLHWQWGEPSSAPDLVGGRDIPVHVTARSPRYP